MIFILNKQEKVVNILRNGGGANQAPPFFDDIYSQDLATGAETFSFSTIAINNIARDLVVGNYVAFKNEDGEYKLFQITQTEEYHEDAMYINVYAEGAGLELINKVFRARKAPSTSLRKFMEMVLDETGWNVGAIPFASQESLDLDLPDATVYATLQSTLSKYGVEMAFRCEINNGRISSKFVDLYTQRGRATGKKFTFGRDIEGIRRKVDSTELFTALIGKGNKDISFKDVTVDGINKPLGQDFVADQEAYDRYNNNGYHIIGIFNYDTESPEELLRETYKQLQKCKEPKIEYEVSVALLGELLGESWNKVSIGDTVAIVDNAFNPPIHLMARVSKLDKSFTNNQSDTCTLANFVEVKSNITDEMRRLASQLEGYVDGALDKKFPIGGEDIQEGAVNGSHIYQNTISTDHLIADAVTADKIKANSIETKHLQADSIKSEHIDTEQIEAEHIKSGTITADKITSDEFITNSAQIKDGIIGTAQIGDAQITVAKIQDLFVDDLVANQGKFQSAHIGVLTSDNIDADTIKADHIMASVIDAINLNVEGKISADKIDVTDLVVDNIDAGKITTGTLDADRITSSVITAINASMENATINEARIGNLSANKITAGDISADRMKANAITAINATIGNATINSAKIGELDASKITTGTLDADRIEAGSIDASKINSDTINAIEIGASEITANKIASGEIKVGDANIIDGTISGAKITKASIGNAQISEAFIADAFVKNITADKIKGGTLDAKEITVKNLNADSITVGQINGRQIAGGAISYDKLDSILSGDIRNTIDNVDQALEDVGLVQETVKKTVKSVDVEYAMNTSSTTAPTTGWQSKPPTWENGKFIWSRTTTVLSDGTSTTTDAVCITGAKGAEGAQGKGVKSIVEQYYLSTSNTDLNGGSWTTTPPTWSNGKYMWTRSVITYTDNSSTTTNPVCVSGSKGDKGDTGSKGDKGDTGVGIQSVDVEYYLSTSSTSLNGGSWSTTAPTWVDGKYIWSRTKTVNTSGKTTYSNSVCITGGKGATGATGASGKGIKSTAITYQASSSGTTTPTGTWSTTIPSVGAGQYLWTRTVITYTDSSTVTSYSIGKMGEKGATGASGNDGKGIKSTVVTYQASTSGTTVPTGSWVSSIPSVSAGQFLWTRTVITYTDNTSSTSYSVGKMGEKGATGATGATGQGVESITEEYYLSTSKTTQTGGSWVTTPPAWSTGKYMWTRSKIVYKNPTATAYTIPVCDNSWEAVNDIQIGGRNLLLNSDNGYLNNLNVYNNTNVTCSNVNGWRKMTFTNQLHNEIVQDKWFTPTQLGNYTFSIMCRSDATSITSDISVYTSESGHRTVSASVKNLGNGLYRIVSSFSISNLNRIRVVDLQNFKTVGATYVEFRYPMLEVGNKVSAWSQAPEDIAEEISTVTSIANGKNSVFYSTSAPSTSGKKENDIWFDTDDGHKMYKFSNGSWVATQFGTNAIVANAITTEKITSSAITAGKIATGAVTTDKLYALAVTADKISANAITAGKIATDAVLANNIKAGAVTTDKVSAKAINADKLDVDNLFVGDNAFIKKLKAVEIDASNITTGTISNDRIDIRGLISFEALDESLKPVFNVQGDKTYINGGLIATNTIKANSIDLLSGITVQGEDGTNTFAIAKNGNVEVNGLLHSGNFDENKNLGYKISPDGTAILNQATIRGDVKLPNAGITNYGATIGNENMASNTTGIRTITGNNSTNQCTTVANLKANSISGKTVIISYKYKFAKGATGAFKVQTAGSHWVQVGENLTADGTEKSGKVVGKLTVSVPAGKEINSLQVRMDNFIGTAEISEIKVEEGTEATPWCPHKDEQLNYVRFWAGTSFGNRESAPFRVYQNGDVFASNGTFTGLLRGTLDSGDVQIYNNAITIHAPKTETEVIRMEAGQSFLNTDVVFGNNNDKRIEYLNGNKELNVNIKNTLRNSRGSFEMNYIRGSGTYLVSASHKDGGRHHIKYWEKHGGLIFESEGTNQTSDAGKENPYDFKFERAGSNVDVNVKIQGNLEITNSIKSNKQNIEMRSVSNEGWGFYAT